MQAHPRSHLRFVDEFTEQGFFAGKAQLRNQPAASSHHELKSRLNSTVRSNQRRPTLIQSLFRQPDIPMPFHALGGDKDKVWERFTADGQPSAAKTTTRLCSLDPDLFACLQDAGFRRKARETLVTLCSRLGLPVPKTAEIAALREQADEFKARQKKGRDSRFKKVALHRRGSTPKGSEIAVKVRTARLLFAPFFHRLLACSLSERALPALTGYRLDTETTSIVQAARIHLHAVSGNDDPRNGLALTHRVGAAFYAAHWIFDAGLWTAIPKGDDFLIHVAMTRFTESSPHGRLLADLHLRPLHFHDHARLRPDPEHLAWHRSRHRI